MKQFTQLLAVSAVLCAVPSAFAQTTTLHLAHNVQTTHPKHTASVLFAEEVSAATGGEVEVIVYPAEQLAALRAGAEGVQLGTVDLAWVDSGTLGNWVPDLSFASLPFIFGDFPAAIAAMDGLSEEISGVMREELNVENLGWSPEGFRVLVTTKKPVLSAADIEGMKVRVPEIPVYVSAFAALKTNVTPLPWGDIYSALQTGVVDAAEGASAVVLTSRLNEVAKYLARTNHIMTDNYLLMNLDRFNGLSDEHKAAIKRAAQVATDRLRILSEESDGEAFEQLAAELELAQPLDVDSFREAMAPVYDEFTAENGERAAAWIAATRK
jgi:tripartite ATP-independent transporter DctP family solute receptor